MEVDILNVPICKFVQFTFETVDGVGFNKISWWSVQCANNSLAEEKFQGFSLYFGPCTSSSSCMHVMNHNWSARKQHLYLQSVAEISRHSVLSEDRIRQCGNSSWSRHKNTDQCLRVAISFCWHRSVPVPCENGSVETTVATGGQSPVTGLWGHTLGES